MAKLSELSDKQLQKAFLKYQAQFKEEQNDRLRSILRQIRDEQQKRGMSPLPPPKKSVKRSDASQKVRTPSKSESQRTEIMELSMAADKALTEKKKRRKSNKITQQTKVVRGPRVSSLLGNAIMGVGLLMGLTGLYLCLDYFFLEWLIPFSTGWMIFGIVMLVLGIATTRVATFLLDDNR